MSLASHAVPCLNLWSLPVLSEVAVLAAVRRHAGAWLRVGGLLLGSVAAAAVMWVILAGPGLVSDSASTARMGRATRVAVR